MARNSDTVTYEITWVPMVAIFAVLLALKTSGLVDWSWWIVTAPLWLLPALITGIFVAMLIFIAVVMVLAVPFALLASVFPGKRI